MRCPHCYENFSLWQWAKTFITLNMPNWFEQKLEKYEEDRELEQLKKLYHVNANLTDREHYVCASRISGQSYEAVANGMNVTRERIRQISAKALRKLERAAVSKK